MIFLYVVGLTVGVLLVRDPLGFWRVTEGWEYQNPEANTPSEVKLTLNAVGGLMLAVICGVMALYQVLVWLR